LEHEESLAERSVCCQFEHLVDGMVLCDDIPLGQPLCLSVAEHAHGFIALDSPLLRYPFASIQLGRALSPPSCATYSAHTVGFSRAVYRVG
jgi:hypothetical protein